MRHLFCVVVLASVTAVGCAHENASEGPVGRTTVTSADGVSLSDAQIADILRAGFIAAIEESTVAAAHAADHSVARYAQLMSGEYRAAYDEERSVLTHGGLNPEVSVASRQIFADSEAAEQAILAGKGPALDQAFLEREVASQAKFLGTIDRDLLPAVRSEELRKAILRVRPLVARLLAEGSLLETGVAAPR
jgi:predicted outer membrane protein